MKSSNNLTAVSSNITIIVLLNLRTFSDEVPDRKYTKRIIMVSCFLVQSWGKALIYVYILCLIFISAAYSRLSYKQTSKNYEQYFFVVVYEEL